MGTVVKAKKVARCACGRNEAHLRVSTPEGYVRLLCLLCFDEFKRVYEKGGREFDVDLVVVDRGEGKQ